MGNKKKRNNKAEYIERIVKREILKFLRHTPHRSFNHKQIAAGANISGTYSNRKLMHLLDQMVSEGKLMARDRGKYQLVFEQKEIDGVIELFKDGFGFVNYSEDAQDIYVHAADANTAMNGDTVRVKLKPMRGRGRNRRPEGVVVDVLKRASTEFVGVLEKTDSGRMIMQPDDQKLPFYFYIQPKDLNGAKEGEKVLVELSTWRRANPDGVVIRVLGKAGENDTEMHAILLSYGFDPKFPDGVEAEADKIPKEITAAEIKKRRDMRKVLTFTIDPHDAKDFDDAISYQVLENGNLEVGVHIADVSHYLKPGTLLDKEAQRRATSVYLVDRTVPMLPEVLSNNLCSLRPKEDKLTFSAIFEIDNDAKVQNSWFGRTIIHSDRRYAYEEAQEIMDAGEGQFFAELTHLNRIAKKLRKRRFKYGAIEFEEDEVKFELDDKGKPIRVFRKVRKDVHKLIEEFMLLANRKVSQFVTELKDPAPTFVYRVHDRPDEEKMLKLKNFVKTLGYDIDLSSKRATQATMNAMMLSVEDKPERSIIRQVAVRSMAKAIYTINNLGHYGLAFKFYSHFTSPIRRYPDVMAHRLLAKYQEGNFGVNPAEIEDQCKHSSKMERKAAEAERASIKQKQVEFLEDKIGEQFTGIVSGVTRWGMYVMLEENKCEGMVAVDTLSGDYYELDEENYCLRGRKTKTEIHLGDRVMVEVRETNTYKRTIDFDLIKILESRVVDARSS